MCEIGKSRLIEKKQKNTEQTNRSSCRFHEELMMTYLDGARNYYRSFKKAIRTGNIYLLVSSQYYLQIALGNKVQQRY